MVTQTIFDLIFVTDMVKFGPIWVLQECTILCDSYFFRIDTVFVPRALGLKLYKESTRVTLDDNQNYSRYCQRTVNLAHQKIESHSTKIIEIIYSRYQLLDKIAQDKIVFVKWASKISRSMGFLSIVRLFLLEIGPLKYHLITGFDCTAI